MSTTIGFRVKAAARLSQMSTVQVRKLSDAGIIEPSVIPNAGPGTPCYYSFEDIVALRVIKELKEKGNFVLRELRTISETLSAITHSETTPLASRRLIVTRLERRADAHLVDDDEGLISLLRMPGQKALNLLVVEYGQLVQELRATVRAEIHTVEERKTGLMM